VLDLRFPQDRYEYEGRSHSLWFCDAQVAGEYAWYETAFMVSPFIARRGRQDPFALPPGEEAAKAVWPGMAEFQAAWPFTRLSLGELDEFIDRWAGWFADAAAGRLMHPSTMPERQPTELGARVSSRLSVSECFVSAGLDQYDANQRSLLLPDLLPLRRVECGGSG
jgi:hypothetical protein